MLYYSGLIQNRNDPISIEVKVDILSQIFLPILLFVLTLISGLRLTDSGQPYNSIFFNTHKLLALGAAR